ncbi:MAG: hypothetical protein H6565_05545 [Lewinellaceae bacterium]|nr:hypothetical protein [Lewinellaceae bacterium]
MKSHIQSLLILASLLLAGTLFAIAFPELAGNVFEKIGDIVSIPKKETAGKTAESDNPPHSELLNENPLPPDFAAFSLAAHSSKWFEKGEAASLSLHDVRLDVLPGALLESMTLSITALKSQDLNPLEAGMVNVTPDRSGYKLSPDGRHFEPAAALSMPFDPTLIPEGYTAHDVRTFYFDETKGHWEEMEVDTLLLESHTLVSKTDHFTDFINGIIQAPDEAKSEIFQQNQISGLKAAEPSEAITLITPPSANQMGPPDLSFSLKIPQGRKAMEPELVVTYTSEVTTNWLANWDISLPAITIDTRWGVPRYKMDVESEPYLWEGKQLSPVAHRGWTARTAEKRFWLRVEGKYSRIIRHGNSPKNYWWEVTDKNGTRHFYGGTKDGLELGSVLTDELGNIAYWALTESRDANGNTVRYRYTKVTDKGMAGGTVNGWQLYPLSIYYTGYNGGEELYNVQFIRDRQLGEALRPDKDINCRLGFKQVTADLLRRIDVKMGDRLIRSYEFEYQQGAFYKTLLKSIIEKDKNRDEFYRHEFKYYDDVRYGFAYKPYGAEKNWNPPFDGVTGGINSGDPNYSGDASILSTAISKFSSWVNALTAGLNDWNLTSKSGTVGGNFGDSESSSEGIATLADITGDGLPDKIFKKDGKLYYRANLGIPDSFGQKRPVVGIEQFNVTHTTGSTSGLEAYPWVVFVGTQDMDSETTTTTYFSDFNGDGLIDVAHEGRVYFNRINANGNPEFALGSAGTPNPIVDNSPINPDLFVIDPAVQDILIDKHPLHDVVRMWEAPYDGKVTIQSIVKLVNDPAGANYLKKDGVRVAIENNGISFPAINIDANDFSDKIYGFSNIPVKKGQRIYFRVQSVFNGKFDEVIWDPEITYDDIPATDLDANGRQVYRYKASEDFLLASPQILTMPLKGKIKIEGKFTKPLTSDDLRVEIIRISGTDTITLYGQWFDSETNVNQPVELSNVPVDSSDALMFRVKASTNVDWSALQWMPRVYYTAADNGATVLVNGLPLIDICPAVGYSMYNKVTERTPVFLSPAAGDVTVRPALPVPLPWLTKGTVTISLKGVNKLYGATTFEAVGGGQIVPAYPLVVANIPANEPLYIEYHIADPVLADSLFDTAGPKAYFTLNGSTSTLKAGLFVGRPEEETLFGPLYRGWGQFTYNGNRTRADEAIHESDLHLDSALFGMAQNVPNIQTPDDLQGVYDPSTAKFVMMVSDPKSNSWRGFDNLTWISADRMSSSRLGIDDILLVNPANPGVGANAPFKISVQSSDGVSGSLSIPIPVIPLGISANQSSGNVRSKLDARDLSGDKIPDIIGEEGIQYSLPTGELEMSVTPFKIGSHLSLNNAWGIGGGGGGNYAPAKSSNTGTHSGSGSNKTIVNTCASTQRACDNASQAGESANSSVGVSFDIGVNVGSGDDHTAFTLEDINGDGLPDMLFEHDTIALNLGFRFAAKELWGQDFIRKGESEDFSAGLGVNLWGGSIQGGVNFSDTKSNTTRALQDVNGDGLLDALYPGNPMQVQFNTGCGFAPLIDWPGLVVLDASSSVGESFNIGGTGCLPVFFGIFKICYNGTKAWGDGVSRQITQIADVDGDGYADLLESEDDGDLRVKSSTIGRTNLLKSVERPLGASFTLDYTRTPNTYAMPYPKWVLASVEVKDGLTGDGPDFTRTEFAYEGGYYDRREREFFGFKKVTTKQLNTADNNALYRQTVQVFENNNYHTKGLLLSEITLDANGNPYTETRHEYELRHTITGAALLPDFDVNASESAFPALIKTQKLVYEGQLLPGLQTSMTFDYDPLGNVTTFTDFGDGTADNWITSVIQYHSLTANYIMSEPKSIQVAINQGLARKRETDLDSKGNVTHIRQFLANGDKAEFDMQYDVYGNLKKITRPKNHKGERLTYEYEYDSFAHTYIVKIKDGYGYESGRQYDMLFSTLVETTDINGQKIKYTLDAKGRVVNITGPYELAANKPYTIKFDYHPEAPVPYALTKHFDPENGGDIETVMFTDGLNRPVQMKKTGSFYAGDGTADDIGMIVSGRIVFDAFGRAVKNWYPLREVAGNAVHFNAEFDDIAPTVTEYDFLDRPVSVTLADGSTTTTKYDVEQDDTGYPCLRTTVTDALNNSKETYTDACGRLRATKDNGPYGDIWTAYRYNGLSELLRIIDDADNTISYTYDNFGRKISLSHPDGGLTEFKYDLAGNMTEKITANTRSQIAGGGAVLYTYDFERLVQIDYPKNFQNRVQFHYGDPQEGFNRRGRIWLQEDASGGQEFYYGPLGEVVKNIRTVLVNRVEMMTFATEYQYDTWERLQQLSYPDGEKVSFDYNLAGKLRSMSGVKLDTTYQYVSQIGYDKFEQRQFLRYGNGTFTNYQYEPDRRRLTHMDVTLPSGRTIMNNAYTYDLVNNVLSITNTDPTVQLLQLGGPVSHQFEYDKLYRLTRATGSWTGFNRQEWYDMEMEYDNTHRILRKTQQHFRDSAVVAHTTYDYIYEYQGSQPHAPSKIGRQLYTYDPSGNHISSHDQSSFQTRDLLWDEENRIMGIWDNGYLSRYTYDASGERIIKSHGGSQTSFIDGASAGFTSHFDNYVVYPSPYFVARRNRFTKHYYIDGQLILSKNGTGHLAQPLLKEQQKITAGGNDYSERMKLLEKAAQDFFASIGLYNYQTMFGYSNPSASVPTLATTGNYNLPPENWPHLPVGPPPPGGKQYPIYIHNQTPRDSLHAGFNFVTGEAKIITERDAYFYHPDHLGSTSYVTDWKGNIRQHIEYFPFGETFVNEHDTYEQQPYLFTAKPFDAESELYYVHNRYYSPRTSMWESMDQLAEKYPGWSPYNYTLNNPVKYVDPDGRESEKKVIDFGFFQIGVESDLNISFDYNLQHLYYANSSINVSNSTNGDVKICGNVGTVGLCDNLDFGYVLSEGFGQYGLGLSVMENINETFTDGITTVSFGGNVSTPFATLNAEIKYSIEPSEHNPLLPLVDYVYDWLHPEPEPIRPNIEFRQNRDRIEIGPPGQRLSRPKESRTGWDSEW